MFLVTVDVLSTSLKSRSPLLVRKLPPVVRTSSAMTLILKPISLVKTRSLASPNAKSPVSVSPINLLETTIVFSSPLTKTNARWVSIQSPPSAIIDKLVIQTEVITALASSIDLTSYYYHYFLTLRKNTFKRIQSNKSQAYPIVYCYFFGFFFTIFFFFCEGYPNKYA